MGVVYRGRHPGLDVPVAIKVLADNYSRDPSFRRRFQREAATIASLNHPGIVRVYDFDEDEGSLFIVMEFVEGRSLRAWLHKYGRFTVDTSLDLMQQMLSAVAAAHAHGIVHRDLKPENVLISTQGKTKILDFGVSKLLDDSLHLTGTGSMVGTPAYMSPEQVRGEAVDARSDIYSLGVILYELMHGEPPFTGQVPAVLHSQVYDQARPSTAIPPPLMELIWKATAKKPEDRFRSCEEFSGALLAFPREPAGTASSAPQAVTTERNFRLKLPLIGRANGAEKHNGACMYSGCRNREGWRCSYTDRTGRQCQTWWCKNHIEFIENLPFCHRHYSVVRALMVTAGTIREIKNLPPVDDRSMALAAMVGSDVDKEVTEILRRRYQSRHDVQLVADKTVREVWAGRVEVGWERSWAAVKGQSYVTRIAIRVAADDPTVVQVLIGNTVVLKAVPDWIARRLEGKPPDQADRAKFRSKIVSAVQASVDKPTPYPPRSLEPAPSEPSTQHPKVSQSLLEGMVLRLFATTTRLTAFEVGERLALPFATLEPVIQSLAAQNFLDALGIAPDTGVLKGRTLPERMAYSISNNGRERSEEISRTGTRYLGPAPVSLHEYGGAVAEAATPLELDEATVSDALDGLEVPPAVAESVRAALNSHGSLFIYGAPGNGKTSLARRIVQLLGPSILIPFALDLDGDVLKVFDPAVHHLEGVQPEDRRWRRIKRPLVQVGGEFQLDMLDPKWDEGSRSYEAPLQVKANGGVLLIDDLGRQKATPKQILDRLLVPLEQGVDYMNLAGSGRKVELPFKPLVALSTNLKPADLLDEAYLRRLDYKVLMPDPTWEAYQRIFERERQRLGIPENSGVFMQLRTLYNGRPMRGNHPRDLLERLVDVASARRIHPQLSSELVDAAWRTLFVAG
jgi:predicted Ser/Thr protein kinase